ncbi:uncharacterized protein LOC118159445 isoform X1 [Oxyura jamaicensis]|uniref:uncharacterized protein LOC118159445 isoform X1 n=1 Tax=Oxyura jamaicensis TaxID=8884 RepID=UPI0015A6C9DC|nr:uncharacterized protein LOC118159445 isoform X1 [Oxyura jamaicensis]
MPGSRTPSTQARRWQWRPSSSSSWLQAAGLPSGKVPAEGDAQDANVDEMGRVKVSSAQSQPCRLSTHVMAARGQAVGEQMQAKSASDGRSLGASRGCALAESPSFHAPSIAPWWAPGEQGYSLFCLVLCSSLNPSALNTHWMPKAEQVRGDAAGSRREAEKSGESLTELPADNKPPQTERSWCSSSRQGLSAMRFTSLQIDTTTPLCLGVCLSAPSHS